MVQQNHPSTIFCTQTAELSCAVLGDELGDFRVVVSNLVRSAGRKQRDGRAPHNYRRDAGDLTTKAARTSTARRVRVAYRTGRRTNRLWFLRRCEAVQRNPPSRAVTLPVRNTTGRLLECPAPMVNYDTITGMPACVGEGLTPPYSRPAAEGQACTTRYCLTRLGQQGATVRSNNAMLSFGARVASLHIPVLLVSPALAPRP